jgi:hypothetical protein
VSDERAALERLFAPESVTLGRDLSRSRQPWARQDRRNAYEVAAYDAEQLPVITDFVSNLVRAYRDHPEFGPNEGNDEQRLIVEQPDIERCRQAGGSGRRRCEERPVPKRARF